MVGFGLRLGLLYDQRSVNSTRVGLKRRLASRDPHAAYGAPRYGLAPLPRFFVGPALDVAFQHAVLEALLFIDRFGHVVKRYDTKQGRAVEHGYIAGVPFEHPAAKFHHVEPGG